MNSYKKLNFINGSAPALNASNLNHMDDGIEAATEAVTALENRTATVEDEIQTAKGTSGSIDERINEINTNLSNKLDNKSGTVKNSNIADGAVLLGKLNSDVFAEKVEGGNIRLVRSTTVYSALLPKADKSDTYTKSEVDTEIAKKADKATTLNSYGITDAYTKSEIDAELAKKINEEDVYTAEEVDERFQRILTAGDNIKIDDNKQGKITISADLSKKYDAANVESGGGDLSLYSENVPVTSAKFNYQKVGDFVMLTFTVIFSAATMSAAKSYSLLGLPYRNDIILRKPAITTSKNKLGIAIAANTATLTIITQGEAVTISDGESIQETLIYKIQK